MSDEPEYGQHDYIADRERQAYVDAGGVEAHQAGGLVGGVRQVVAQVQAEVAAGKYGQQQAQALSQGHQLRDKPGALGSTHYLSYPHKELFRFVHEKFEPGQVHEAGRYYNKVGNDLVEFSGRIRSAAAKTEDSWKGEAGNAMRAHVTGVSDGMGRTGEAAQLTANQIGMQAEAGEQARNAMPEDPEFDMAAEMRDLVANPNPFTIVQRANEIQEHAEQAQAKHQEAAQVVSTMEGGFGTAAASTPKFAPPPPPPPPPGDTGGQPTGRAGQPVGDVGSLSQSSSTPSSTSSASVSPSSTVAPSSSTSSGSYTSGNSYTSNTPGTQSPANTSSAWNTGGSSLPPGTVRGPDGTLYRQDPRTGQWMRQNSANGRWAPVPPGQQVPGVRGGGAGGRSGGVPGGGPGGAGGSGGRTGGGFGPRGSVPAPGQSMQPGGRAGVAPGSPSPSAPSTSTSSTSSSARGGGRMPMGGMGGGNQQNEDEEHENKYVLESDEAWEDLDIPPVAPRVIGAAPWEKEG